ncbi:hypothetical protein, partial [Lentimicrobium sp.]|uniref:hypothetical protein n=1 Tax=Lentimicrobium sp. TaxID=2034841 RepID=UPI002BA1AAC2
LIKLCWEVVNIFGITFQKLSLFSKFWDFIPKSIHPYKVLGFYSNKPGRISAVVIPKGHKVSINKAFLILLYLYDKTEALTFFVPKRKWL